MSNVAIAFIVTLIAGLATGIGSAIALFANRTNTKFLSLSLGFSAGVMIYVAFMEIMAHGKEILVLELGEKQGGAYAVLAFFASVFIVALIDKLIPSYENPHEAHPVEELHGRVKDYDKLRRVGLLSALAIAVHNFPEGIATFVATLDDPSIGIAIGVAIAIHNIPEGIAVSVPIYYATGSRKKAFTLSFLSGLCEPLGAFLAYLILMPFLTPVVFGLLFAGVAGIMVFISLDVLLPAAEKYGNHHLSIYGVVSGMLVMATSLILL